jgi:hypothetical protein
VALEDGLAEEDLLVAVGEREDSPVNGTSSTVFRPMSDS